MPIRLRASPVVVLLALGCSQPDDPAAPAPLPAVHARALTPVQFERTAFRVARGRYLANAAIGCVLCHSERDATIAGAPPVAGREFAGAVMADEPGRRVVAPNLTPDVETGAGSWSDDALARAIREGVGHDGRGLGLPMWWWSFRALSDEDLASIVVYLRSLPPVRHALPARVLSQDIERECAEAALPLDGPVPPRDLSDPLERGIYLIEIADCMGCHTAWEAETNPGLGGGGNPIARFGARAFSANLTPDPSGLGGQSEDAFLALVRGGRGGSLDPAMPWVAYREMTDDDLRAIYRALRQVPPVAHWVRNAVSPTPCVVCGQEHGLGDRNAPPALQRVDVDLGPLERYAGTFRLETDTMEVSTRDGAVYVSENGGRAIEVVPVGGGRFRGIGLTSPLAFEFDAGGALAAVVTFDLAPTRWERAR